MQFATHGGGSQEVASPGLAASGLVVAFTMGATKTGEAERLDEPIFGTVELCSSPRGSFVPAEAPNSCGMPMQRCTRVDYGLVRSLSRATSGTNWVRCNTYCRSVCTWTQREQQHAAWAEPFYRRETSFWMSHPLVLASCAGAPTGDYAAGARNTAMISL